jgi:cytoskeletal protein RodZ
MEEISYSGSSMPSKKRISKRVALFGIFFVIILLLLGSVAYFVTSSKGESEENTTNITLPDEPESEIIQEETPTPEETEAPTPSITKSPTKSATKDEDTPASEGSVAVQNGSGESGVAAAAADIIKNAGFSIATTGNADNFDYTDVTIRVKSSKKSILSSLEDALSAKYTVGDTSTDLPESTNYDALVIIGK